MEKEILTELKNLFLEKNYEEFYKVYSFHKKEIEALPNIQKREIINMQSRIRVATEDNYQEETIEKDIKKSEKIIEDSKEDSKEYNEEENKIKRREYVKKKLGELGYPSKLFFNDESTKKHIKKLCFELENLISEKNFLNLNNEKIFEELSKDKAQNILYEKLIYYFWDKINFGCEPKIIERMNYEFNKIERKLHLFIINNPVIPYASEIKANKIKKIIISLFYKSTPNYYQKRINFVQTRLQIPLMCISNGGTDSSKLWHAKRFQNLVVKSVENLFFLDFVSPNKNGVGEKIVDELIQIIDDYKKEFIKKDDMSSSLIDIAKKSQLKFETCFLYFLESKLEIKHLKAINSIREYIITNNESTSMNDAFIITDELYEQYKHKKMTQSAILKILTENQKDKTNDLKIKVSKIGKIFNIFNKAKGTKFKINNISHLKAAYMAIYISKIKYKNKFFPKGLTASAIIDKILKLPEDYYITKMEVKDNTEGKTDFSFLKERFEEEKNTLLFEFIYEMIYYEISRQNGMIWEYTSRYKFKNSIYEILEIFANDCAPEIVTDRINSFSNYIFQEILKLNEKYKYYPSQNI